MSTTLHPFVVTRTVVELEGIREGENTSPLTILGFSHLVATLLLCIHPYCPLLCLTRHTECRS